MSEGITVGGCYPPSWPRPPKPPVPEPVPNSLDEQVDWMTYSHPELYDMIHSGLDLTGAMHVSAKWARLGEELSDIGDELARLLTATAQAWTGDTAELAKESVGALSDWSRDSGQRAKDVCACITVQVDNATTARNSMPKPPYPLSPQPKSEPDVVPMDAAFVSGGFADAAPLVADPQKYSSRERALHQQAAATMQTFQNNTRDVYETVPQFAPPTLRRQLYGGPVEPPSPQPPLPPNPQPQPPVPTVPSGPVGGGGRAGAPMPTGGGTPRAGGMTTTPNPLAAGAGTGAAEPAQGRPAAAAAAGAGRPGGGQGGMGGVPMGGHGAQGGEDKDRKAKRYLEGDDDMWGLEDEKVMPPVIGEANRRA